MWVMKLTQKVVDVWVIDVGEKEMIRSRKLALAQLRHSPAGSLSKRTSYFNLNGGSRLSGVEISVCEDCLLLVHYSCRGSTGIVSYT